MRKSKTTDTTHAGSRSCPQTRSRMLSRMLSLVRRTLVATVVAAPLSAQGTGSGPIVLRLPASARIAAMANAGLSITDADALFYNPAMLNTARGVAASMQRFGSTATTGALASVTQIGTTSVGIGVQLLDWSSSSGAYETLRKAGEGELAQHGGIPAMSSAVTVGVARVVKRWRVGLSAKYAEERIQQSSDGAVAMDVGVTTPLGPGSLSAAVQNIGGSMDVAATHFHVPTRAVIGWGTGLSPRLLHWDAGMQSELSWEQGGIVRGAGGVEVGYVPIDGVDLIVRAGLQTPRDHAESFATAGVGFTLDRISADYAFVPYRDGLAGSHRVGLRIR